MATKGAESESWRSVAHFLYGDGFWYADPLAEIAGLTEEQLYWVPAPGSLCALWQVGHIATRERLHFGVFMQGLTGAVIPSQYRVFLGEATPDEIRAAIGSLEDLYTWIRQARQESHHCIDSMSAADLTRPAGEAAGNTETTPGHWLYVTAAHTALHIGRIQMLRALIEGKQERAC
ncbi:MAG: DinB family protein [Anaerolineae bacterium]